MRENTEEFICCATCPVEDGYKPLLFFLIFLVPIKMPLAKFYPIMYYTNIFKERLQLRQIYWSLFLWIDTYSNAIII